jgi:hypothetical protein
MQQNLCKRHTVESPISEATTTMKKAMLLLSALLVSSVSAWAQVERQTHEWGDWQTVLDDNGRAIAQWRQGTIKEPGANGVDVTCVCEVENLTTDMRKKMSVKFYWSDTHQVEHYVGQKFLTGKQKATLSQQVHSVPPSDASLLKWRVDCT